MAEASKKKKVFDNRYEVLSIVGRGARSVVYHARYIDGDQEEVALKVLLEKKDGLPPSDLLRKEALAMVSSRHKYVIRLDDFHSLGDICYLTMEFAPQGDLRKYLKKKKGNLSATQTELFLLQAGEAVDFVHKAGILHRDIKPENLLVVDDQNIRIGDFGVAILPGEKSSLEELQKGIGTLDYLSPEVLEGRAYDRRSDLYALGVTFYELLSGHHPFAGVPLAEQVDARKAGNFQTIQEREPEAPAHLLSAIHRMMSFDPDQRFQTARDLIQGLVSFDVSGLSDEPSATPPPRAAPAPGQRARRAEEIAAPATEPEPTAVQPQEPPAEPEAQPEPEPPMDLKEADAEVDALFDDEPTEEELLQIEEEPIEEVTPPAKKKRKRIRKRPGRNRGKVRAVAEPPMPEEDIFPEDDSLLEEDTLLEEDSVLEEEEQELTPTAEEPESVIDEDLADLADEFPEEVTQSVPEPAPTPDPIPDPLPEPPQQPAPAEEERSHTLAENAYQATPPDPTPQEPASDPFRQEAQPEEEAEATFGKRASSANASTQSLIVYGVLALGIFFITQYLFSCGSDPENLTTPEPPQTTATTNPEANQQPATNTVTAPAATTTTNSLPAIDKIFVETPTEVAQSFPQIPGGVYSGHAIFPRSGERVPFSLIAVKSTSQLIMALGIPGFSPIVINLKDFEGAEANNIRVASQGMHLAITGAAENGVLFGTITNETSGEVAEWTVKP